MGLNGSQLSEPVTTEDFLFYITFVKNKQCYPVQFDKTSPHRVQEHLRSRDDNSYIEENRIPNTLRAPMVDIVIARQNSRLKSR